MRGESTSDQEDDSEAEFVETDPTNRYHRGRKVLGKGAFKKVYWAFDELEGIEVAWNQIKISELLRKSEDLERLYSEVHILKTLKHKHIIKFHHSWVDTKNEHINFITEIFTSGTLRQYRMKHKRVDLRALKKWSKQILEGLQYLHSRDPPIIHRDLKCDNIFVNGNHGELKIGDLGLAAILHHANGAHSVLEFMAPELYEEEYNELVDIYAFGMCVLELVTFEYPYTECANAAQIYKKVTSGIKPASLAKVTNPGVKDFIERCITDVSKRLSAKDLLNDPFLADVSPESTAHSSHVNILHLDSGSDNPNPGPSRDLTVHGERQDVKTVYIKLRIADSMEKCRNIHFPFDIEADTSIAVASEMVHELDLTDQDITTIADMIDSEVRALIPDWSPKDTSGGDSPFNSPTTNDLKEDSSPHNVIENKDDTSPLSNASPFSTGGVFPDQLPSGRKFWSDSPKDSPKAGGGMSPIELSPNSPSEATEEVYQNESSQISTQDFETNKIAHEQGGPTGESLIENTDEALTRSMSNLLLKHKHDSSGLPPKSPRNFRLGSDDGNVFNGKKSLGSSSEEDRYSKKDDISVSRNQNGEGNNNRDLGNSDNVENYEGKSYTESDLKAIADTLDELLAQQQKQLEELKLNHKLAISHVLKDLPPQLHPKVFNLCSTKMISHMPNAGGHTGVGDSSQVPVKRIFTRSLSTIDLSTTRSNTKQDSTSEMGIAVILKKDSEEP